jgi:hypothetical protein
MEAPHYRLTYDYRIQEAICESGDRELFPELNIPRSTIRSWIHREATEVVSCDLAKDDRGELVAEIEKLRSRTALLGAVVGLLIALLRVSKVQLDYERLPEGDAKRILLRANDRSEKVLPLNAALRITRLSASRYYGWCRAQAGCDLDDQRSFRVMPHSAFEGQTPDEVFFGTGHEVSKKLAEARETARKKRMEANRAAGCGVCVGETRSGTLLLQRPRSKMS